MSGSRKNSFFSKTIIVAAAATADWRSSLKSLPITPYKKIPPASTYVMKSIFKNFFRTQSQSAAAAVKQIV